MAAGSRLIRRAFILTLVALTSSVLAVAPASGQVARIGDTFVVNGTAASPDTPVSNSRWTDVAYDSVNNVYLVVFSTFGSVMGRFVSPDGAVLGAAPFVIPEHPADAYFYPDDPRVAYSPDAGGFLVVWKDQRGANANDGSQPLRLFGRMIAYRTDGTFQALTSNIQLSPDGYKFWPTSKAALAYSTTSKEFLVVYRVDPWPGSLLGQRLTPMGGLIEGPFRLCGVGDVDDNASVVYNPTLDEFYVAWKRESNTTGAFSVMGRRVKAGTGERIGGIDAVVPVFGPVSPSIANVNVPAVQFDPQNNRYLVIWFRGTGGGPTVAGQFVNPDNSLFGTLWTVSLSGTYDAVGLSRNPRTGTYLSTYTRAPNGDNDRVWGRQILADGSMDPELQLVAAPSLTNYSSVIANTARSEWLVGASLVFTKTYGQRVGSGSAPPSFAPQVADFNGDGNADLVWRNRSTGEIIVWYMKGAAYSDYTTISALDPAWRIGAIADFNVDHRPDLLLRNIANGENYIAFNDGNGGLQITPITGLPNQSWTIGGVGDFNADGKPDIVWRNMATGENMVWHMDNASQLDSVAIAPLADVNWRIAGVADFNGDGKPDIVWRNRATGANGIWHMNGTNYSDSVAIPAVSNLKWVIADVADLNRDGRPDLVWRNTTTGDNVAWFMRDGTQVGSQALPEVPAGGWDLLQQQDPPAGTGDLNSDGMVDVVWRNTATGANRVWFMNGTRVAAITALDSADPSWKMVGTGDFNGDARPDVAWQNTATGETRVWFMNGSTFLSSALLPSVPDTTWRVASVGDFNGDGKMDLVWRNTVNGSSVIWYLDGINYFAWTTLPTVADQNWQIADSADVNADGSTDIIWHNQATGESVVWLMHGSDYSGYAVLPRVADTNWRIVAVHDYDGDGKPDIAWQNQATGQNVLWIMDGPIYRDWTSLPGDPDTNWKIGS